MILACLNVIATVEYFEVLSLTFVFMKSLGSINISRKLAEEFDLTFDTGLVSKEQIIQALTLRIDQMIHQNPDQLFSMLYRLDISEKNLKLAMAQENDVPKKIATLIYERQLEKMWSRKHFANDSPDEDLAW